MPESASHLFRRSALRINRAHVAQNSPQAPSPAASATIDGDDETLSGAIRDLAIAFASSKGADGQRLMQRLNHGQSLWHALALPSEVTEFIYARAHRWFAVGRPDKAEPLFQALCLLDDGVADFWVGLGVCLRARSAWDQAMTAFDMAAGLRPEWAIPRFHALELLLRREQWGRAAIELAAFELRVNSEVPPVIVAEAARYKTALAVRAVQTASVAGFIEGRVMEGRVHEPD